MLSQGVPMEQIEQCTGLSESENKPFLNPPTFQSPLRTFPKSPTAPIAKHAKGRAELALVAQTGNLHMPPVCAKCLHSMTYFALARPKRPLFRAHTPCVPSRILPVPRRKASFSPRASPLGYPRLNFVMTQENSLLSSASPKEDRVPLPERLRPDNMDLFLGQTHLETRIHALLGVKNLPSLLFFGPPGCGKSTIALLLAKSTGRAYRRVSAPEAGITQLRRILGEGVDILILDELHRFTKAQQDFFLPLLEDGSLTLLATTTENPSFSVTRQLLSRLSVLRLRPLDLPEMLELARRGASQMGCSLNEDVLSMLCDLAHGDARTLLNLVEYVASLPGEKDDPQKVKSVLPDVITRHDKAGDSHYELASALIKSIRGSDPDAAIYYLACLLEGGEDPRFICRRLILSASEDVGLADPQALPLAVACQQAVEFVGMPEGFIPLAETVTYLALARKSNSSYAAYLSAQKLVREQGILPVPLDLRNPVTALQREWGYGRNYQYPHNFRDGWVKQRYLPEGVGMESFYRPKENGEEPRLAAFWRSRKNARGPR